MPLVLLTDWRETKPCMQILAKHSFHHPQVTLVYTQGQKQLSLASRWVCTLVPEVRDQVSLAPLAFDAQAIVTLAREALQKQPRNLKLSDLLEGSEEKTAKTLPVAEPETTSFMQLQSRLWTRPVSEVLGSIISSASSTDISHMLTASLPEVYDD